MDEIISMNNLVIMLKKNIFFENLIPTDSSIQPALDYDFHQYFLVFRYFISELEKLRIHIYEQ